MERITYALIKVRDDKNHVKIYTTSQIDLTSIKIIGHEVSPREVKVVQAPEEKPAESSTKEKPQKKASKKSSKK